MVEYMFHHYTVDTQYPVSLGLQDKGIPSKIVKGGTRQRFFGRSTETFFQLQSFSHLIFAILRIN